jgi:hypothetical protein
MSIKANHPDVECDRYFPLGDQHTSNLVTGVHPDAATELQTAPSFLTEVFSLRAIVDEDE